MHEFVRHQAASVVMIILVEAGILPLALGTASASICRSSLKRTGAMACMESSSDNHMDFKAHRPLAIWSLSSGTASIVESERSSIRTVFSTIISPSSCMMASCFPATLTSHWHGPMKLSPPEIGPTKVVRPFFNLKTSLTSIWKGFTYWSPVIIRRKISTSSFEIPSRF